MNRNDDFLNQALKKEQAGCRKDDTQCCGKCSNSSIENQREKLAFENGMAIEFVNWFFDNKKDGCGNAWFMMMAAMWEGWSSRDAQVKQLAAENTALKAAFSPKEIPTQVTDVFSDAAILKIDGDEFHSRQWVDNEEDVILAVLAAIKPETPATDKIADHQRAEGVEEFAAWQKRCRRYVCRHPGSVGEQEARNAEKLALKFAAYLREGQHD